MVLLLHLQYGILCWVCCCKTAMQPLNILLNKAIRCINFCNPKESIYKFLTKDNIILIDDMFKLELGKFMHNFNRGILPVNFRNYFTKLNSQHNHQTRATKYNFFLPRKNTNKGLKSLNFLGPKLWSEIPDDIRNVNNVKYFSICFKKLLLGKYSEVL